MKKNLLLLFLFLSTSLLAQMPPPPVLQPGEHWSKLWSVSYDYQSNGSVRYLEQDPNDSNSFCTVFMAQHDSNTAAGVGRYIYYSYSDDNGFIWFDDVVNNTSAFGFPCLTLSNGLPVIAAHQSGSVGMRVWKELVFGGFTLTELPNVVPIPGSNQPIWGHIAGTTNGNLVMSGSPNDGATFYSHTNIFNGSVWSNYTERIQISGPSGNYDVASGPNGKVVLIGYDYNNDINLTYFLSTNNGVTFANGVTIAKYIVDGSDILYFNLIGGYQAVFDNSGNLHILVTAYNQYELSPPSQNVIGYIKPRIYHWSEATGFNVVAGKANIPNLTDTLRQNSAAPLTQPTISITGNGTLIACYTAYLQGNKQAVNNGDLVNTGEIFYSISYDNGLTWSNPVNLTNTPFIEEKYPSLAPKTAGEKLNVTYSRDMKAGPWVNVVQWGKAPVYSIYNSQNLNMSPSAPQLISPLNNSNNIILTPLMDWQDVFSANSYRIQIASDINFNTIVLNQSSTASQFQIPSSVLNNDATYYWRVNATNGNGTGDWSSVWNFRTVTFLPPAPILVSPPNGNTGVNLTPVLDWNDAPSASTYTVQLSSDSAFLSPIINISNIAVTQYSVPPSLLSLNSTYYWRVNSTNSNGTGSWSEVWRFTTFFLPTAPVLISPANGSTEIPLITLMDWNNVTTAVRYRLQISLDSGFSAYVLNDSGITVSEYTTAPSLLINYTKYYWRVNAINEAGTGSFSSVWNFTTTALLPAAPVLISPVNGATNVSLNPLMDWGDVTSATSYRLQIAIDVNFNSIILDQPGISNSNFTVPSPILGINTLYFWRVDASNLTGEGPWSLIWIFRTQSTGLNVISEVIPTSYFLHNNYPNPFNPTTKIKFDIPETEFVSLIFFDINGKEITRLINDRISPGSYEYEFSADKFNLSSGIYFYKIISGDFVKTLRMILIK